MAFFEEQQPFYKNSFTWLIVPGMLLPLILLGIKAITAGSFSWFDFANLFLVELIVFTLVFFCKLETRIDSAGIRYRLFPFQIKYRLIEWNIISKAYVRRYNPLSEYWGWGIKGTRNNRAINIAGDVGLQLELKDHRKLLIGTLQKEKMEVAIQKIYSANLIK
ncbi:MAG: hypothetical protein ACK5CY_03705 [Bacteroidia bacterium]|jgi:hypothetical protein